MASSASGRWRARVGGRAEWDSRAISGESGSSALGSVSIEQIESRTDGTRQAVVRVSSQGRARHPGRGRTFRDGQRGRPLISQDVQADGPVRVDVGVVDLCRTVIDSRSANGGAYERAPAAGSNALVVNETFGGLKG